MKLFVLSDLHNEFRRLYAAEAHAHAWSQADVIVLAGDIDVGVRGIEWGRQAFADKPIVYVAGNHEFYTGYWDRTLADMRQAGQEHGVHFLEDTAVEIAGVRFLGCSLWTDFDLFGEGDRQRCMRSTQAVMADYNEITNDQLASLYTDVTAQPHKLKAEHTRERHLASRRWLEQELAAGVPDRTVVVTHHFVSMGSNAPRWRTDPVSAGFGSQLPPALLVRAGLWIHGHTHDSCAYVVRHETEENVLETRVVCNPRGYPRRSGSVENERFDPELLIEV
jgi:DNA repair exonuclease SbcCD nuclease subunit